MHGHQERDTGRAKLVLLSKFTSIQGEATVVLAMASHRDILDEIAEIAGSISKPAMTCNPQPLVPSPRGIQDALVNALSHAGNGCCSVNGCNPKAEVLEISDGQDIHCQANVPQNMPENSPLQQQQQLSLLEVPQPRYTDSITPWIEEGKPPVLYNPVDARSLQMQNMSLLSPSTATTADEFEDFDSFGSNSTFGKGRKSDPPKVMPPTAKSILERRERAIREGRRHDARLSSEERRIVRRLRNRESAERCAKRKTEEAEQMSRRIACLEEENEHLRRVASQYEAEISSLETSILQCHSSQGEKLSRV